MGSHFEIEKFSFDLFETHRTLQKNDPFGAFRAKDMLALELVNKPV
jgi:hypothetical protein